MIQNIHDFSQFGFRELKMAAELLNAYVEGKWASRKDRLDGGLKIEFNPNSGNVFLVDDEFNVAMMNGYALENWFSCGVCGTEGFRSEVDFGDAFTCKQCAAQEVWSH